MESSREIFPPPLPSYQLAEVLEVLPDVEPRCAHLRFKALSSGSAQEFRLAGVRHKTDCGDDFSRSVREEALGRLARLVSSPSSSDDTASDQQEHSRTLMTTPRVSLRREAGSGTPPLAHLALHDGSGWVNLADMLTRENHVIKDKDTLHCRATNYTPEQHGNLQLWHLVMLVLLRARNDGREFHLATNVRSAGTFSDVVLKFRSSDNSWTRVFLKLEADEVRPGEYLSEAHIQCHKSLSQEDACYVIVFSSSDLQYGGEVRQSDLTEHHLQYPDIFTSSLLRFNDESARELAGRLESETCSRDDVTSYLHDLQFAVNQPCVRDMRTLVQREILEERDQSGGIRDLVQRKIREEEKKLRDLAQWDVLEDRDLVHEEMLEEEQLVDRRDLVQRVISGKNCTRRDVTRYKYRKFLSWVQKWMQQPRGEYINNATFHTFWNELEDEIAGNVSIIPRDVVSNFHARDEALTRGFATLSSCKGPELIDIMISGEEGVGKSELALKLLHDVKHNFKHVIFINAQSKRSLTNAFLELSNKLNVRVDHRSDVTLKLALDKIYHKFSKYRTLFIFDDFEDCHDIYEFLPSTKINNQSLYFIATSIQPMRANLHIELQPFSAWESVYYLVQEIDLDDDRHVGRLGEILGHFPLALRLAAAYINQNNCKDRVTVSELVNGETLTSNNDYDLVIKSMLSITFKSLKRRERGELAVELLEMLALVDQGEIPVKMFADDHKVALKLLSDFALVQLTQGACSVDRKVQRVVRDTLTRPGVVLASLLSLIEKRSPCWNELPKEVITKIVRHVMSAWGHVTSDLVTTYSGVVLAVVETNPCWETSVLFLEDSLPALENSLGWNHDIFLHITRSYLALLSLCGHHARVVTECDYYFAKLPPECFDFTDKYRVLSIKVRSLLALERFEEAYIEAQKLYHQATVLLGYDAPDTLTALADLWSSTYQLHLAQRPQFLHTFLSLLQLRFLESQANFDTSLYLLSEVTAKVDLTTCDVIKVTDLLCTLVDMRLGQDHVTSLYLLLRKSAQLYRAGREEEAWLVYTRVCRILVLEPGRRSANFPEFLESTVTQLGTSLHVTHDVTTAVVRALRTDDGGAEEDVRDYTGLQGQLRTRIFNRAVLQDDIEDAVTSPGVTMQPMTSDECIVVPPHSSTRHRDLNNTLLTDLNLPEDEDKQEQPLQFLSARKEFKTSGEAVSQRPPLPEHLAVIATPRPQRQRVARPRLPAQFPRQHDCTMFQFDETGNFADEELSQQSDTQASQQNSSEVRALWSSALRSFRNHDFSGACDVCSLLLTCSPHGTLHVQVMALRAQSLHELTRHREASDVWYEVYMTSERSLGLDHPATLRALVGLCRSSLQLGGEDTSWQLWLSIIKNRLRLTCLDHARSLHVMKHVDPLLRDAARADVALELHSSLYLSLVMLHGAEHPLTLAALLLRAECLWHERRDDEAWQIYRQACHLLECPQPRDPPCRSEVILVIMSLRDEVEARIYNTGN